VNGRRLQSAWICAVVACVALALGGCARKPAGRAAPESDQADVAAKRLPCLDGLKAYTFAGQFAFDPGGAAGRQQIGSLANLLKDVRFDGAFAAPDATRLHVTFPSGANQALETIQVGGKKYQRVGDGAWEAIPAVARAVAPMATPPQHANSLRKASRLICQHPRRSRKIAAKCQRNNTQSSGRWERRTGAAIKLGNKVRRAWEAKNAALCG